MLASVLIIAVSLVLLLYWFRYTCLLLLQTNPVTHYAGQVARANRLGFLEVQSALKSGVGDPALDQLHSALENDYRILLYLLQHSTGLDIPALEQRMLAADYRVMRAWYRLARRSSPEGARHALLEMSSVLAYFSQKMGERVAQNAAV